MNEPKLKILLIEDDEDDYVLTRDLLLEAYHGKVKIDWINKYNKALVEVLKAEHDIYIVDYHLGNDTGIKLIEEANSQKQSGPFIVLTGEKNHSTDSKAIKAGAEDYLVKGQATSLVLERSIRYAIERHKTNKEHDRLLIELSAKKEAEKNATKTANLLEFTSDLLETVTPKEVAEVFAKKGLKLMEASAGSIVLLNKNTLRIIQASGYSKKTLKKWREFQLSSTTPIGKAIISKKPVYLENKKEAIKKYPILNSALGSAWVALPIITRKQTLGAIGVTYNKEFIFTSNDRAYFLTIVQQVGQALERAKLYELEKTARTNVEISQSKIRFLNEATQILSSSLDYKKTLTNVAKIVVPELADWCGIDILTDEGNLQNLVVIHQDPEKVKWAKLLQKKYPPDLNTQAGVAGVITTGKSEIYTSITKEMLKKSARDKEHLKMLRSIGFKSIMIVPLKGQSKILGTISFIASESERQFTMEDLLFAEELAARAATAIDNAILYQKSLEGIKIRDEFLNIAAHELRTPLTSLQLQMQLLMNYTKSTSNTIKASILQKSLTAGELQTKRLGNLINNLLDVSRMSNKKIELEKDHVELNSLLKDVISRFDGSLKHTGTKVLFKNGTKVSGNWDKFRLDQVITNLLSNAIKYGEGKPIKLSVKKNKNKALICIKDNGMGMDKEDVKKIFNRFVRTEAAKKYGGLGLGLYISKQIVEAHSGTIRVNSAPNKGTEFTVKLPIN